MKDTGAKFDVLGSEWTLFVGNEKEFPLLKEIDGYADKTGRFIVVSEKSSDCDLADFAIYQRKCIRHEIIHAYLFESGLHENIYHGSSPAGHPEQMVDWFAVQFPKILKTYEKLGVVG